MSGILSWILCSPKAMRFVGPLRGASPYYPYCRAQGFACRTVEPQRIMKQDERRRAVRAPAKLAMEVKLSGKACGELETINVSANGVYFASPTFIAPLTRLEITLLLPEGSDGRSTSPREVACEGVVVRTEPETEDSKNDHYDVACYFTSITERDREDLESYILAQLTF